MNRPQPDEGQRIAAEARALGLQKHPSQAASEAVEAVLAIPTLAPPYGLTRLPDRGIGYNAAIQEVRAAIRRHLPEAARTEGADQ